MERSSTCFTESQREAYDAIRRALVDGHVHMAVTSEAGFGKTVLLEAVLTNLVDHESRVIHIREPDGLDLEQVRRIERIASAWSEKGAEVTPHTIIAVDDAHTAPFALLRCMAAITAHRKGERGAVQLILAGRPQLWSRLASEDFAPLAERLILRLVLGGLSDDDATSYLHRVLAEPRRVVGQVMTPEAEKEIVHLAAGRPGRIGAIVMKALERTDMTQSPSIGIDEARAAAAEIDGRAIAAAVPVATSSLFPKRPPIYRRGLILVSCAIAGTAALGITAWRYDVWSRQEWRSTPLTVATQQDSVAVVDEVAVGDDVNALLQRGDAAMKRGDILKARSAYERAAMMGSGKAAWNAGRTYDLIGGKAGWSDPILASTWYARAVLLGEQPAEADLKDIEGRH